MSSFNERTHLKERDNTHTFELLKSPRSLFLLPAPGGTTITWLAEDWPGLALLSVFELSLIFWALSLMLFRLLFLLALLAIKLMMLNTDMRRAIILKALISPFAKNYKGFCQAQGHLSPSTQISNPRDNPDPFLVLLLLDFESW